MNKFNLKFKVHLQIFGNLFENPWKWISKIENAFPKIENAFPKIENAFPKIENAFPKFSKFLKCISKN